VAGALTLLERVARDCRPPDVRTPVRSPDSVGALLGAKLRGGVPPRAVLVGFPCDDGVRRNGGRPGAAEAPPKIREWLYRFLPDAELGEAHADLLEHTLDAGDVTLTGDLAADQLRLAELLVPCLEAGVFPIVLGGGHETTYGHFLAYALAGRAVSLLNWDAHPDVRELRDGQGHSGSPFRQALLHPSGLARGYTVAGLLPHVVSRSHLDFMRERGARWVWRRDLTPERVAEIAGAATGPALVSFDVDAVEQSCAPGVSAPAAGGLPVELWLHAADLAGRGSHVLSVDVVELNPRVDQDDRTARLAALTVWTVLRGRAAGGGQ